MKPSSQQACQSAEELLPAVYTELRRLAAYKLANELPGQTLQATALVHEAWLRLQGDGSGEWTSRRHFFGAAAEAMRRILVDRARRRNAARHGGGRRPLELNDSDAGVEPPPAEVLAVHEALDDLAGVSPLAAELVKLRFFVGLGHGEAAEVLEISRSSADRAWLFARAWLYDRISEEEKT